MTFEEIEKWKDDAIIDGWLCQPLTNKNVKLEKDGFSIMIYLSTKNKRILGWGPDALAIQIPKIYSFDFLIQDLSICSICGKKGKTVKLNFADRVCPECRDAEIEKTNY